MGLIGAENRKLPSSSLSYEEFAVDADETFEQAVKEVEEAPSFNWRKNRGEKLREEAENIPRPHPDDIGKQAVGMGAGGIVGALPIIFADPSQLDPFLATMTLCSGMMLGGFASMAYDPARKKVKGGLGSFLQNNSGYTQVRSDEIDQIKSVLSDPDERPNNIYAVDFDGFTELYDRRSIGDLIKSHSCDEGFDERVGIEGVLNSLSEQYAEAQWAVERDEGNPFQVIGMTLENQPETGYDAEEYDQRRRLAKETVEALGSGSVEDILSTHNGVAPTSPRYEDKEFDVVIVDRNPEQSYDPEDNFLDYSNNLSSPTELTEEKEELQREDRILKNQA